MKLLRRIVVFAAIVVLVASLATWLIDDEDKDSGELRRPHHIDLKSGKYRGREILAPKESV